MTLDELLEAAYRSDYIALGDLDELNNFAEIWKDLLDTPLEDLQLSTVEVRHGTWTLDLDDSFPLLRRGWRCSECGRRQTYGTTPYCPYCGRKMEVKI